MFAALSGHAQLDPIDPMTIEESLIATFSTRKKIESLGDYTTAAVGSNDAAVVDDIEARNCEAVKLGDVKERSHFDVGWGGDRSKWHQRTIVDTDAIGVTFAN